MFSLKINAALAMNPQTIYILLVCLLLTGTVMLFLTVKEVIRTISFLRTSLRADGTVVRFDPRRNSEGSIKYRAVVSFKASDNQIHEIQAGVAHTPPAPEVGTVITVRYLPDSPQTAKIENFWEIWESSFFYFVIFFAMLFFVSVLIIILNY
jgi:hypothetical protein